MKVLILTNGEYGDYTWCQRDAVYDYIICADNGMKHAKILGIVPNIIVGDFDSGCSEDLIFFEKNNVEILKLPCEKDETDTEVALDLAIEKSATHIDIYGGLGSRIDHTLGNIHLLYKALKNNISCYLLNDKNQVTLMDNELTVKGAVNDLVSLIPFTEKVSGVTTEGLAYSLTDGVFEMGKPYGVSNYLLQEVAKIKIEQGLLLVIQARD